MTSTRPSPMRQASPPTIHEYVYQMQMYVQAMSPGTALRKISPLTHVMIMAGSPG